MANETRIGWTDRRWNVVTGCTEVSSGCAHCYARGMANRLKGRHGYPADDPFRVTLHPERLGQPLAWRKAAKCFVCSMGDLFHEDVPSEFLQKVFTTMMQCPQHTFQVLTKRPERMSLYYLVRYGIPLPNVWLGTSVENQSTFDLRVPHLVECPAAVRFLSIEPMLSEINIGNLEGIDWVIVGCESRTGRNGRIWDGKNDRDARQR